MAHLNKTTTSFEPIQQQIQDTVSILKYKRLGLVLCAVRRTSYYLIDILRVNHSYSDPSRFIGSSGCSSQGQLKKKRSESSFERADELSLCSISSPAMRVEGDVREQKGQRAAACCCCCFYWLTCEVQGEGDEAVIARQELQGFLPLHQSPEVIRNGFPVEEVVDANQEVPEVIKRKASDLFFRYKCGEIVVYKRLLF